MQASSSVGHFQNTVLPADPKPKIHIKPFKGTIYIFINRILICVCEKISKPKFSGKLFSECIWKNSAGAFGIVWRKTVESSTWRFVQGKRNAVYSEILICFYIFFYKRFS